MSDRSIGSRGAPQNISKNQPPRANIESSLASQPESISGIRPETVPVSKPNPTSGVNKIRKILEDSAGGFKNDISKLRNLVSSEKTNVEAKINGKLTSNFNVTDGTTEIKFADLEDLNDSTTSKPTQEPTQEPKQEPTTSVKTAMELSFFN